MSNIDNVIDAAGDFFTHLDEKPSYIRILDTPNVWGLKMGREIMPRALDRQAEFQRALVEIMQKSRFRCDLSSLNCPDPAWSRVILGAMDTALSTKMNRDSPTQFRFLFGQTPINPFSEPINYADFKAAVIRLVRMRKDDWEVMPDIWLGRFYRLQKGVLSGLKSKVFSENIISSDDTRMTWNHTKVVAVDGTEALVGGHNLNMDLFRSYPPVHDVSVVVHGGAALGAQLFLNKMWDCGNDLLTKEHFDTGSKTFVNRDKDKDVPVDPLDSGNEAATEYINKIQASLLNLHQSNTQSAADNPPLTIVDNDPQDTIESNDRKTLSDLKVDPFAERVFFNAYQKFDEYRLATRVLSIGKYWKGPNRKSDYQKGSEIMKECLIKSAKESIRMSQMDLISAWKKNWSDHVVCHWIMEALLDNKDLTVEVVVSPLDAGAGAEGDQYSFGSGAIRTFQLIEYYMIHEVATDKERDDKLERLDALNRLYIAPFFFTDKHPEHMIEGDSYKWPDLDEEGKTATLKQPPVTQEKPKKGIIGSAAKSVLKASGKRYEKIESAPGNHSKIMIIDDELYVVGSDNLYPGYLSEFNYLVEGKDAVNDMLTSYWNKLWKYSSPHARSGK